MGKKKSSKTVAKSRQSARSAPSAPRRAKKSPVKAAGALKVLPRGGKPLVRPATAIRTAIRVAAPAVAPARPSTKLARDARAKENSRSVAGPGAQKPGKAPPPPAKPAPRKLPSAELTRIRNLLSQKKQAIANHLQNELIELEKPEKRHRADLEEIASDTHDTDSLCEIMDIEATQIDQIDMALAKIENGTYGLCEDCGQEIPMPRLEALPFATQCIACKRRAEIRGEIAASDSASSSL